MLDLSDLSDKFRLGQRLRRDKAQGEEEKNPCGAGKRKKTLVLQGAKNMDSG